MIERLEITEQFLGIIVYGSCVMDEDDEFSDLDVLIIVDDKYDNYCGRGNFIIEDKFVEFFIKTQNEIYEDLIDELKTLEPVTRNMLLTGIIMEDKYSVIRNMQERAKEINQMPYNQLSETEIQGMTITIRNQLKEVERKNKNKDKDLIFCFYNYLYELIKVYCNYKKIPIRKYKFYKVYTDEKYRINNMLMDISDEYVKKEFINLIEEIDVVRLKELTEYILKEISTLPVEYRIYTTNN